MAQAQQAQRIIKVNIPFEFSVGDREFPAGSYSLASSAPPLLDVRDAKGHTLVRLLTNSVETQTAPASPLLEFISDGGRYSLAEVWQENDLIGQQLPQSKAWAKVCKAPCPHRNHRCEQLALGDEHESENRSPGGLNECRRAR